jgi:two-component system, NtrC family, sensor kinase
LSFVSVSILGGSLSLAIGVREIAGGVRSEAYTRVRQDLNVAREIYQARQQRIETGLAVSAMNAEVQDAMASGDAAFLDERTHILAALLELDFAGFVGRDGAVLGRLRSAGSSSVPADPWVRNQVVLAALSGRSSQVGTVVLDERALAAEDPALAARARIEAVLTPHAAPNEATVETRGLTITAAVPVLQGSRFVGVIYGGLLLNRNTDIVDKVRETVFQGEAFQERHSGTATIFLHDLRVSTNVTLADGTRAIGTRVSEEVKRTVLDRGGAWTDRAFVVNDWYISAYEPVADVSGATVGILYVGVLERKYVAIRSDTVAVFAILTLGGVAVSIVLGWFLGNRFLRPILELVSLSGRVSKGDLSARVRKTARSEIGQLQNTFNQMVSSLSEREAKQREESEAKLFNSERQASVGRLAAGVAHEINNPLTGTLTFTHLLLRRKDLPADVHQDLELIAHSTERVRDIVRGLLDFSRQTQINPLPLDINELVKHTVSLVENQALMKGVELRQELAQGLKVTTLDRSQMQSVVLNIVLNAIDATERGGSITVGTSAAVVTDPAGEDGSAREGLQIVVTDTGCGIPPENMPRLFEPFFTTKEVGKGTGMGLSVSRGIVEKHRGTIRVTSTVGRGSAFVIWLPIDEGGHGL